MHVPQVLGFADCLCAGGAADIAHPLQACARLLLMPGLPLMGVNAFLANPPLSFVQERHRLLPPQVCGRGLCCRWRLPAQQQAACRLVRRLQLQPQLRQRHGPDVRLQGAWGARSRRCCQRRGLTKWLQAADVSYCVTHLVHQLHPAARDACRGLMAMAATWFAWVHPANTHTSLPLLTLGSKLALNPLMFLCSPYTGHSPTSHPLTFSTFSSPSHHLHPPVSLLPPGTLPCARQRCGSLQLCQPSPRPWSTLGSTPPTVARRTLQTPGAGRKDK